MQRKALRATVGGVDVDIPIGTFSAGQALRYNATGGPGSTPIIDTVAAASGDVVGPASSVDNHLALFNGTTGKLLKDSSPVVVDASGNMSAVGTIASGLVNGVSVQAHAARHLPAGADSMFPGTWAANDEPVWNGSAWIPKRRQVVRKTTSVSFTVVALANVSELSFVGLRSGSAYRFRFYLLYSANLAGNGIRLAVDYTGTATPMHYGAEIPSSTVATFYGSAAADASPIFNTNSVVSAILPATIEGVFLTSTTGDLNCQAATETAPNVVNINIGSFGEIWEI